MFQRLLEHKITFAIAVAGVVAVIGIGGWYVLKPPVRHYTAAAVSIRDIQESVEASGVIDADQHVSLAFRAAGTVAAVDVSVGQLVHAGQVLATLDNSTLAAGLEGADADVLSAEANLSSVERGATSETRAVSSQGVATAAAALGIAENDTYIKVLDAILNKSDTLFANGTSPNPILVIPVPDATAVIAVNSQRVDIGQRLNNWKNMLAASSSPTDQGLIQEASSDISATQSFLNTISAWTNRLNVNNTGLTQDQIMAYVSAMNGALVEVNAAAGEFTSALQAWRTAGDQQAVVTASSTDESVQIAQAAVAKARAAVASFQSQIANGQLVAPFDGVIGSVSPKVGQAISAGTPAIDILSTGGYKIDIMVPENQVALISESDPASITFDAYGGTLVATGTVASIDLSPTVRNGIGAYKATVRLNGADPRIRTGMTANVTIQGARYSQVLCVPTSAIIANGSSSIVLKEQPDGSFAAVPVTIGASDGSWTAVTSGLTANDRVAAYGDASPTAD